MARNDFAESPYATQTRRRNVANREARDMERAATPAVDPSHRPHDWTAFDRSFQRPSAPPMASGIVPPPAMPSPVPTNPVAPARAPLPRGPGAGALRGQPAISNNDWTAAAAQERAALQPGANGASGRPDPTRSAPMVPATFKAPKMKAVTLEENFDPRADFTGRQSTREVTPDGFVKNTVKGKYGSGSAVSVAPNKWQLDVMAAHPEIGKAGTPLNAKFVQAFQQAGSDPSKAMDIANAVRLAHEESTVSAKPNRVAQTPEQVAQGNSAKLDRMKNYKVSNEPVNRPTPQSQGADLKEEWRKKAFSGENFWDSPTAYIAQGVGKKIKGALDFASGVFGGK